MPGCGKSLTAKAVAAAWRLPLLRLDVGRVFAGLVGSSEQNMRTAIRTAEAIAPVRAVDRRDREGLLRRTGGGGDAGTTPRVFGTFLTWMQEKTAPVFVIATANDIDRLPPELLRKGRFDEIFFVDLPTAAERASIWGVHSPSGCSTRRSPASSTSTTGLRELARLQRRVLGCRDRAGGRSPALFDAFAERRPLRQDDLIRAVGQHGPAERHPGRADRRHPRLGGDPGGRRDRGRGLGPERFRNIDRRCRMSVSLILVPLAVAAVSAAHGMRSGETTWQTT